MKIIVDNKIRLSEVPFDLTSQKWLMDKLILENPEYHKKVQMGKWTGNTPQKIRLYEVNAFEYILPFGLWSVDFLKKMQKYNPSVENHIKPVRHISYDSSINLYDYQQKAVTEALRRRNGVIVMPCGSGKTQTALELISRIGGRTLWLTHTHDLLVQSMNRAKSVLGVSNDTYGKIASGKVSIGSGITFATVQTMSKIDLTELKDSFDVIIVDECHKAVGSPTKVMQFYKVLSNLSCRYKFGLTATPKRNDGLEKSMFALLGEIVCEVPKDVVAENICDVKVNFIKTGYTPSDVSCVLSGDGTLNYARLIDDLTHDTRRFDLIMNVLNQLPKKPMIVLANRVEYLEKMNEKYSGESICLSSLGTSKKAKEIRKKALTSLNNGKINCIFATYLLAKEGLDVPNLEYVVFATPEKDKTTVIQSSGRVGRKADGKDYGTVIDFEDSFGMFKGWTKKRKNIYKKLNYEMMEVE